MSYYADGLNYFTIDATLEPRVNDWIRLQSEMLRLPLKKTGRTVTHEDVAQQLIGMLFQHNKNNNKKNVPEDELLTAVTARVEAALAAATYKMEPAPVTTIEPAAAKHGVDLSPLPVLQDYLAQHVYHVTAAITERLDHDAAGILDYLRADLIDVLSDPGHPEHAEVKARHWTTLDAFANAEKYRDICTAGVHGAHGLDPDYALPPDVARIRLHVAAERFRRVADLFSAFLDKLNTGEVNYLSVQRE